MNAKEFYKEKTSHELNDDCGVRLTGKELFELMEEYANTKQVESREVTDEDIEKMAKDFQHDTSTSFNQGMYSGYIFGMQAYKKAMRDNKLIK